ncbi:hypothetical protein [Actinomadura atramentaria]|uniref:hypothetical protein n=1 Tax=Actinomadura atramentaria TaxID=1990 RepID=UPI000376F645|nr:hypothetical protein [Actinomadura atramentaria]
MDAPKVRLIPVLRIRPAGDALTPAADVTTAALRALLADALADDLLPRLRAPESRDEAVDEVPALDGGFLLDGPDGLRAEPSCCSDLGALPDWRAAARHRDSAPPAVWTGHPWLLVSADGDLLRLRESDEHGPGREVGTVPRADLAAAVADADSRLSAFAARVHAACAVLTDDTTAARVTARLLETGEG